MKCDKLILKAYKERRPLMITNEGTTPVYVRIPIDNHSPIKQLQKGDIIEQGQTLYWQGDKLNK